MQKVKLTYLKRFQRFCARYKLVLEQYNNLLVLQSYFNKSLVSREDVHWLFILTFPNGGSTALAELLLSAPSTMALTYNAEGHWLIPSLCKPMQRWNKDYYISERKLRAAWLNRVNRDRPNQVDPVLVIEKSPAHMCRYRRILSTFEAMKCYLITFTRDPYATCASWHKRYGLDVISQTWKPISSSLKNNEWEYYKFLGAIWLERANMILEAKKDSLYNLRYEDFTENTSEAIEELGKLIPQLRNVSLSAKVKVKDYEEQRITNMNEKQIGSLSAEQIAAISSALAEEPDTVEQLGYSIR